MHSETPYLDWFVVFQLTGKWPDNAVGQIETKYLFHLFALQSPSGFAEKLPCVVPSGGRGEDLERFGRIGESSKLRWLPFYKTRILSRTR